MNHKCKIEVCGICTSQYPSDPCDALFLNVSFEAPVTLSIVQYIGRDKLNSMTPEELDQWIMDAVRRYFRDRSAAPKAHKKLSAVVGKAFDVEV